MLFADLATIQAEITAVCVQAIVIFGLDAMSTIGWLYCLRSFPCP
jgi:hypothetical protein